MICPTCSNDNPSDFAFCGYCGKPLPQLCPNCGLANLANLAICQHCGALLAQVAPPPAEAPDDLALMIASAPSLVVGKRPSIAIEGERRFVAVLFADIAGFTRLSEQLDPEEAVMLVNQCLNELTRVAVQYGGRLVRYLGDGMLVVFGAPTAHEDDPERALQAALEMKEQISKLKLDLDVPRISIHLGLACGQVVAAGVGGQGRKEYTVIGSAVNLAARLEQASGLNQILVSEELNRLTRHVFAFKPVVLPYLQGIDSEVNAFELLGKHQETAPQRQMGFFNSPMVGRSAEVAVLQHTLENLIKGQGTPTMGRGSIISIIGEVGVGKSRLLREIQAQSDASHPEINWLNSNTLETGETLRYGCFQSLLRNAIGAPRLTDRSLAAGSRSSAAEVGSMSELLAAHLSNLLPTQADWVYPYLAKILGLPLPAQTIELLSWMDEEDLLWQNARAIQMWISALADQRPLVLAFEDLHWMDSTSARLLEQLLPLAEQKPILILCTFRPEPERPAWRLRETELSSHANRYTEAWLQPLSSPDIQEMVAHLLETDLVPETALDLVALRTDGNPLFIEELIRSMIDRGTLAPASDNRWELTPGWEEASIPNTIQGILQARVDRLERDARRVLQMAACIDRQFSLRLLAEACEGMEISPARFAHSIRILEAASLIQPEGADADEAEDARAAAEPSPKEYKFKHNLIRETVYHSLLKGTRAQLHGAIAQWYEANWMNEPEPPYALLAYHYERTDQANKKHEYFIKAGYQAAHAYDNLEALAFYTKALALVNAPLERYELLLEHERVCDLIGNRDQQRADLDELLKLANLSNHDRQIAEVHYRLAIWHENLGDYSDARLALEHSLAAARRANERCIEVSSLHRLASICWRQGQFDQALSTAQTALQEARAIGDRPSEAISLTTLGVVHRTLGSLEAARDCYQQALEIRQAAGDRREIAISLSQLGNLHYDAGDYTQALNHHRQALEYFRMAGDRRGEAWSTSGLGNVYLHCGDLAAAHASFEQALEIRRLIADRGGDGVALGDLGNVLLAQGRTKAAIDHLQQAVHLLQEIGAPRDEAFAQTYLARAFELANDLEDAQALHQTAIDTRRDLGQQKYIFDNLAGLARLALEQNDLSKACAYVEDIREHIHSQGFPVSEAPFLIYLTAIRVMQACNRQDEARQMIIEANHALQSRAEKITDQALRRSFLEKVPEHAAIVSLSTEVG